jgi:deoxyribose-phosphate aldolase
MKLEYSIYDTSLNENELKENINQAIKYSIDILSVLPIYLKTAKSCISDNIKISAAVDYPLGTSDLKTRISSVEYCIKNGAKVIDIVAPPSPLANRKYDKFREDIKTISEVISSYPDVEMRYFLEYRIFSYDLLYKISQILRGHGIKNVFPSTGYFLDDINDNILASVMIKKKVQDLNIICNGNIWNNNQISSIKKANLDSLRLNSLNALELFTKNIAK